MTSIADLSHLSPEDRQGQLLEHDEAYAERQEPLVAEGRMAALPQITGTEWRLKEDDDVVRLVSPR